MCTVHRVRTHGRTRETRADLRRTYASRPLRVRLRDPGESGEPFSPAREVGARHAQFAGLQAATNQGCVRAGRGEEPDVPAATRR
jgi:hypothetical protein